MIFKYPLLDDAFNNQDINEAIKVLKSKRLIMSGKTKLMAENYFTKKLINPVPDQ